MVDKELVEQAVFQVVFQLGFLAHLRVLGAMIAMINQASKKIKKKTTKQSLGN